MRRPTRPIISARGTRPGPLPGVTIGNIPPDSRYRTNQMTTRRLRLSIESLDDRITPASAADLTGLAQQTVGTAMLLQELSKDPMALASPVLRPAVRSYFTGVYQHATTTLSLIGQFPGTLPAAEQRIVSQLAQIQVNIAQSVAARLGFTVTAAGAPAPAPAPTPGSASA